MYFFYPYAFFLLCIPFVLFLFFFQKKSSPLRTLFTPEILVKLSLSSQTLNPRIKYVLFLLVLVLFIFALARPVKPLSYLNTSEEKVAVILALDVSKSMYKTDVYPNRLNLAKVKLSRFLRNASGLQIGILLYAKDAYMLYPLTQETQTLYRLLSDGGITHKFASQSNLFAALEASHTLLGTHLNRHIVLLSDGGEDTPRKKELQYLKSKHIALSALALTTHKNKALSSLCKESKGYYQPFTWGDEDIDTLIDFIKHRELKTESYRYDVVQYDEYFQYPLLLALLLLLVLLMPIRKEKKNISSFVSILILLSSMHTTSLEAGFFDFWHLNQAKKYAQNNQYETAILHYKKVSLSPKVHYNIATLYYKQKHYRQAISQYKKALGTSKAIDAKIFHNIANAYVAKNKLSMAKKYYIQSLETFAYKVTKENLDTIQKQIKLQRKNVYKKYEKLHFKALNKKEFSADTPFTNYAIKLHDFLPTEEEKWFNTLLKQKSSLYLQKIPTTKRSSDANLSW